MRAMYGQTDIMMNKLSISCRHQVPLIWLPECITTLRTVSRRQATADKTRSLTRVSASTKRRVAVMPFAQQAQSGARGAQMTDAVPACFYSAFRAGIAARFTEPPGGTPQRGSES
ncbi:hypothetical protein E4U52_004541 [Claviceps spartinae]|nr:hypothetical protein E4U52_004541 [Claviceps spartinae]